MRYELRREDRYEWAETSDGRVTAASPAIGWARSQKIEVLLAWAARCGFGIRVHQTASQPSARIDGEVWKE